MNQVIIIGALELGGIFSIMSLGLYISYKVLNLPDLTVDGSFTLGCNIARSLFRLVPDLPFPVRS